MKNLADIKADIKNGFLNDLPKCKRCNPQMNFMIDGEIHPSEDRPFPMIYALYFHCPKCKNVTAKMVTIKRIDLRCFSGRFLFTCIQYVKVLTNNKLIWYNIDIGNRIWSENK